MKLSVCTLASAAAITNAQLTNIPGRLRTSPSNNEWGRDQSRRTQAQRTLEESSLSMSVKLEQMAFDASISMPDLYDFVEYESSMSMSVPVAPAEPEIGETITVAEETEKAAEVGEESAEAPEESAETVGEEDFIDGEFVPHMLM
jgi:hypothetical protein